MELTREKIQEYKKVKEFLDEVCEKYFDKVAEGTWQFYSGWGVYDDKTIRLYYCYCNHNEYTIEGGHIGVNIDELIEFSKTLNK